MHVVMCTKLFCPGAKSNPRRHTQPILVVVVVLVASSIGYEVASALPPVGS